MPPTPARSTSSEPAGNAEPRIWTPPLRPLTPDTSYGYDVIDFSAEVLGIELDPWQQWLMIHAGELLADGRPRFRIVLALVARQNGKSLLARVLILYWLTVERVPLVLGLSTDRGYAKLSWREAVEMAKACPWIEGVSTREQLGEEVLRIDGSEYRFAASNRRAGRSLTVHRLLIDELREHRDWEAWGAAVNAMQAVPGGQVITVTNQGDENSVVLDSLRDSALGYIETGQGDPRLGIFEWSAPAGADPRDPEALAMANPSLGARIDIDTLTGAAHRAVKAGGEELASFRTEVMCQRVALLDAAIDEQAWAACGTDEPVDLAEHRQRVALCLDVALDGSHATLVAAVQLEDRVHLDVVHAWDGYGCVGAVKRELPAIVAKVRPSVVGWFPAGPAAALAAELRANWTPRATRVEEVKGDLTAACMGLAAEVTDRAIIHPNDPLLDRHVTTAQRLRRGDAWVFGRRGSGPVDAAYAVAGAVHLARTMPPPRPKLVAL